uniref:hypothetical protein n=1 Tax=Streptobacillus moniliformis TaxID=34105 RepID=UPI000AE483E0
ESTAHVNKVGYDITNSKSNSGAALIPTQGELAIGQDSTITRRLTGVAAGEKDTDAVNVAQLKHLASG